MSTFRVIYKPTGELVLEAAERIRRQREEWLRRNAARRRARRAA